MSNEPVVTGAVITGAVSAVLVALVQLGVIELSQDQQTAIVTAIAAVLPIVSAVFVRRLVTPVNKG